jgi:hypothetical protein
MLSVLPLIRVRVRVLHVCNVTADHFGCHTHGTSFVSSNMDDNDVYKMMMMMVMI